jgi:hypothetical protein
MLTNNMGGCPVLSERTATINKNFLIAPLKATILEKSTLTI